MKNISHNIKILLCIILIIGCGSVFGSDMLNTAGIDRGERSYLLENPETRLQAVYNGVDYSKVYDYSYYIARNPDVERAFGGDPDKTLKHFVEYGMKEGRIASAYFNVHSYINSYKDLRSAYGNDLSKYYLHYINYGCMEGRRTTGQNTLSGAITSLNGQDYSDVYDFDYYISRYPDIRQYVSSKPFPDIAALEHFINYGMKEGRIAKASFNVKSYIYKYPDLRQAFGQDISKYYMHYIAYGKREGRVTVGVTELQNPISSLNGKDYSRVYNYDYYISRYPDIKNYVKYKPAPDVAAFEHFIKYGMKEQRQGCKGFDVKSYYKSYQDLRVVFYKDYPKYYEHYIKYGYNEKRKATGETVLQNPVTKYKGVDFGSIYDYKFYTDRYGDIAKAYGEDDIEVLHHYVKYGINEGRRARAAYDQDDYDRLKKEAGYIVADEKAAAYKYSMDRLLKNAIKPVGSTMYIWGGGWNEEDTGAGVEAVSIGLSPRWKAYADAQNSSYDYNNTRYQIHDGLDCTGFIGWTVYNTFNDRNGGEGYVSEDPEAIFLSKGWGYRVDTNRPKPGDICTMATHVWMSLGCCPDGSILLVHSSPPGCILCGTLFPDGSRSQAVALAESVMSKYYPNWYRRYPDCTRSYSYITDATVFRWNNSTLADPNNLQNMSAYEIVDYLFH